MRELDLPSKLPGQSIETYLGQLMQQLSEASRDRPEVSVPNAFAFTNFDQSTDAVRTYDPATVTLEDLAKAFATFVVYMQKQGPKRK